MLSNTSEEQETIRAAVRRFAEAEIAPVFRGAVGRATFSL